MATPGSYWGGHFPEPIEGALSYWGGHFPEPTTADPGYGPATAGTFQISLDAGTQLTLQWATDIRKSRSGVEQRANLIDRPRQFYRGPMFLATADSRPARGQLAQYAALGTPFLVGLTYEALAVTGASTTAAAGTETHTTIPVTSTALIDWGPGQRVVIDNPGVGAAESVVVSVAASSITVNTDVSTLAIVGARIMPGMPTLLDPQQGFDRYKLNAETWNVSGRAAVFGFASNTAASLSLADPLTTGVLQGLEIYARVPGDLTMPILVSINSGGTGTGQLSETIEDEAYNIVVSTSGSTTAGDVVALFDSSSIVGIRGTYTPSDLLTFADLFSLTELEGGASALGDVGTGATLTTFRDLNVWTAGVNTTGTVGDSLQSMHEVEDLGGVPFAVGSADMPEWGRAVQMRRFIQERATWQWLMLFLDTVRGRWRPFWLSTFRPDLVPVSVAAGELVVESGTGEVFAHWPAQRTCLQIVQADYSVTWVRISNAEDNGDDTVTLTIVDEDDDPVTLTGTPRMVSWLEKCRFESDDIPISFDNESRWTMSAVARVIPEDDEVLTQPREVFEIVTTAETWRLASGVLDIAVDGDDYEASPIQRAGIVVSNSSGDAALTFTLPASHPLVERYAAVGAPPRVEVTVRRYEAVEATTEIIWAGNVAAMSCTGNLATFTVPSRGAAAGKRRLPIVSASRTCAHVLYDSRCSVARASFKVTTTVANINGRVVDVASIGGEADQWARYGEIVAVASGERMLITDQEGERLTLRTEVPGLTVGESVEVYAGCAHDRSTCDTKFDNQANFGGQPRLPTEDEIRFRTNGFGVLVIE